MSNKEILKEYWGFDDFRPLQEDIINAVLEKKDVLALLPTGGGKSICFQVPALAQDGICLVVSPLIALIKDQVQNLKNKGIPALSIYSGMSFIEVKKTLQNAAHGNYKFLYVSPERLETNLFLDFLPSMNINLIAVDESHCISQWGYDFRPSYLRIAALREYLPSTPILALTASATKIVQDDICEKLLFTNNAKRFQQSFERPNLSYSVFNVPSKQNKLLEILNNVKGSAIVYCKSRKQTKEIADLLKLNNINADFYHAGLSNDERNKRQEDWIKSNSNAIVCTNAFGMGIDKPNVKTVVHYEVPDCLENYYQEAGRAGRDGKRAYAVLLFNDREINDLKAQTDLRYPSQEDVKKVYISLMNYLQIAAGGGEGMSFDFDIVAFSTSFKLNILSATYAIKTLEQENIIRFNEVFFNPSTVVFNCSKDELNDFEIDHPDLGDLIKGLLRSYEGIFDYPATIREEQLAKFIQKNVTEVVKELLQLKQFGIIAYSQQKDKPQITLLQNRMYTDSYLINLENHLQRKKEFEKRVNAMISYINNTVNCRSSEIAHYFNDPTVKKCGICDNCINQKELVITKDEFEAISIKIISTIKNNKISVKELLSNLRSIRKEKIWKVLDFLQGENKIGISKDEHLVIN
ncbi:MAG: ATP-dependent DNA helicase RecQ [Bacteroidota bacterium]